MTAGDILGHEPMGIVQEVGSEVTHIKPGDRVVIPFNISCGHCFMCTDGLQSQCETTQVREQDKGAALFGYTSLYGSVPGGQAEYLRVPQAQYGPIKVSPDGPDERYLFLSDILPTAWQAVEYANAPEGGTLAVFGLGPVGQFAARIGRHLGQRVIGVDLVPERREMAARHGIETVDPAGIDDVPAALRDMTDGTARTPSSTPSAWRRTAVGATVGKLAQAAAGLLPDALSHKLIENVGVDRLTALHAAIDAVRRGGTVSISGVYGGAVDPMPMMDMFDKQIQLRMGQCNVRVGGRHPAAGRGRRRSARRAGSGHPHRADRRGAQAYKTFQEKTDGCIKVVLKP